MGQRCRLVVKRLLPRAKDLFLSEGNYDPSDHIAFCTCHSVDLPTPKTMAVPAQI